MKFYSTDLFTFNYISIHFKIFRNQSFFQYSHRFPEQTLLWKKVHRSISHSTDFKRIQDFLINPKNTILRDFVMVSRSLTLIYRSVSDQGCVSVSKLTVFLSFQIMWCVDWNFFEKISLRKIIVTEARYDRIEIYYIYIFKYVKFFSFNFPH